MKETDEELLASSGSGREYYMRVSSRFLHDDAGAVTIDWVTLTAGILLAGMMAIYSIYGGGVSALVAETNELANAHYENVDPGSPRNLNSAR